MSSEAEVRPETIILSGPGAHAARFFARQIGQYPVRGPDRFPSAIALTRDESRLLEGLATGATNAQLMNKRPSSPLRPLPRVRPPETPINSTERARHLAAQIHRPLLTALPHPLDRYYDPECLGASPVMKRRIHDTDFAVRRHVDPWGSRLHPYLVHLERV